MEENCVFLKDGQDLNLGQQYKPLCFKQYNRNEALDAVLS